MQIVNIWLLTFKGLFMLKWYGYLGLLLIILAEVNFHYVVQPFADWYIVIIWTGYILLVDSLVYRIKGKSLVSSYPKEILSMAMLSLPFWLIFEFYNFFTHSWYYVNYLWYVHIFDFITILPAVMETFTLVRALKLGTRFDSARRIIKSKPTKLFPATLPLAFGLILMLSPIVIGPIGVLFMWSGIGLFIDPLNYITGRASLLQKASIGIKSTILQTSIAGLIMGFFWEFWNYQAYPQWVYTMPSLIINVKIFAMPVEGYIGYIPFGITCFLFYAFFRHSLFKNKNDLLAM